MPVQTVIKLRRETAANWTTANPVLALGEPGLETDTGKVKYGDGTTAWASLAYSTSDSAYNLYTDVKNGSGSSIAKGTPVYVSSANGTNMLISVSTNANEAGSSKTLGLLTQTLANNGIGRVTTQGLLSGLDTSAATAGDPVWLGVNGALIYGAANKPVAPAHMVFIGIVTRAHATNGEIFVRVQNGFEIDELHDVLITSKTNGDLLKYDSASGLWKNAAQSTLTIAESQVTNLTTDLAAKAPTASPTFTGTPAVPPAAVDTNTTQAASTAFVVGQAGSSNPLVNGTAAAGTSLRYARQDHVHPTDTSRAPAASPVFTGTVTTPLTTAGIVKTNSSGVLSSVATIDPADVTGTAATLNGVQTFTNKTFASPVFTGAMMETMNTSGTFAGWTFYAGTNGALQYPSSANATSSGSVNITWTSGTTLNSYMANGQTLTVTLIIPNGSTAYYPTSILVDGASVNVYWQGGTIPNAGNINSKDVYTFVVLKAATSTFYVWASVTKFA